MNGEWILFFKIKNMGKNFSDEGWKETLKITLKAKNQEEAEEEAKYIFRKKIKDNLFLNQFSKKKIKKEDWIVAIKPCILFVKKLF